jgi:hypothetical protein
MADLQLPITPPLTSLHRVFRYQHLFALVASVCALFLLFTTTAMFLYPGGTGPIASTHGYRFFVNFLSDLGQTRTQSGAYNYPSMLLFTSSMVAAGIGLGVFFITFAHFFTGRSAHPWARRLTWAAAAAGGVAAICFIGVGVTPYNLFYVVHEAFAQWAFRFLLAAIILEIPAIRLGRNLPTGLFWINLSFVALLSGYILLVMFGPSTGTLIGEEIHVVGQKAIVYMAVATLFTQALLARSVLYRPAEAHI